MTGAVVTSIAVTTICIGGTKLLHLKPETLTGVLAGAQTQPAVLAFAGEKLEDDREVDIGYALVCPVALIAKLVLAYLILRL